MSTNDIEALKEFIKGELEARPVIGRLQELIQARTSTAGTRPEEVFTREFFCPVVAKFFYEWVRSDLRLSDDQIRSGLGTEGYANCPGFGFTPARSKKHVFTKSDLIKTSHPVSWLKRSPARLPDFQACPDFAITRPLPFTIVGEVKYFKSGTPDSAIRELYNATRQAVFYLGAFHGAYESAMIVVGDGSRDHAFFRGLELIKPELLARFGADTSIHLVPVKLR